MVAVPTWAVLGGPLLLAVLNPPLGLGLLVLNAVRLGFGS